MGILATVCTEDSERSPGFATVREGAQRPKALSVLCDLCGSIHFDSYRIEKFSACVAIFPVVSSSTESRST